MHEIICDKDGRPVDYRFLDVNPAFERLTGLRREEVIGRTALEVMPEIEPHWIETYGQVALTGEPITFEEFSGVLGKYFEVYAYSPVPGLLAALVADVTQRKLAEAQQQVFYRRTIYAATQGKLVIMDRDEVRELAGPAIKQWDVGSPEDIGIVREDAVAVAQSQGMDEIGVHRLITCVVEGVSNALKHAGAGRASLHRAKDGMLLMVEDQGPGIGAMNLPDVALLRGYSTAGTLGMGDKLMIASCRRVYLATGPQGTTTAFEIPLVNSDDALNGLSDWGR